MAGMTWQLSVSRPEPLLERLEVRPALVGDRHDLAVQHERRGEAAQGIRNWAKQNLVNECPFLEKTDGHRAGRDRLGDVRCAPDGESGSRRIACPGAATLHYLLRS